MHQTLLVELFTEELPPKALKKLGDAFASLIAHGLKDRGLTGHSTISNSPNGVAFEAEVFATPRRLAVCISHVLDVAADQSFVEKLMPVAVGLDKDGHATPALTKKLAAKNLAHIDVATLEREHDGKADQLIYRGMAEGQSLQAGLQQVLDEAIKNLPVPKVMSYQLADGATTVQFVRPAHGLVALYGANVVPVTALGLTAGRTTHGHRFQGAVDIELKHADEYESRLENEGAVVASFDKRKKDIESQLRETAELHGANLGPTGEYAALLDEVTALVERPTVYVGAFETEFLSVPAECLILTMKLNQKYFPLFNRAGKLSNQFLIVSNMRLDDPHNIIEGNQRVVRPRLSDAKFFFNKDKAIRLQDRNEMLAGVTYHSLLGSVADKTLRIESIAEFLVQSTFSDAPGAERAASLCKYDLVTDMVGEFPELQGVMGKYYAREQDESEAIQDAIEDHYKPRFSGDVLPRGKEGEVVAMADRIDSLVSLFLVGEVPNGEKDPFALRRAAVGVIRILIERRRPVDVADILGNALKNTVAKACFALTLERVKALEIKMERQFDASEKGRLLKKLESDLNQDEVKAKVFTFIYDRLRGYLREAGYTANHIESVVAQNPRRFDNLVLKLEAVLQFSQLPEAISLAAANKRIGNILKKSDPVISNAQQAMLAEPAERSLFEAMQSTAPKFDQYFAAQNYTAALKSLAPLKIPVDAFFENVMVNADDLALRNNRLALLNDLHLMMNKVADLSKLAA